MTVFTYTAAGQDGSITTGSVEGVSIQDARSALKVQGIEPMEIHEATLSEQGSGDAIHTNWVSTEDTHQQSNESISSSSQPVVSQQPTKSVVYLPLIDTLRIYAGWLTALLGLSFVLGFYQHLKVQPVEIPLVRGLLFSPLLLQVGLASFLFLLLTSPRIRGTGNVLRTIVLLLIGTAVFLWYRANIS